VYDILDYSSPELSIYSGYEIYDKFIKLDQIIDSMCVPIHSTRPECSQVLSEYNLWSIDRNCLENDPTFESTLKLINRNENKFFIEFFKAKYL